MYKSWKWQHIKRRRKRVKETAKKNPQSRELQLECFYRRQGRGYWYFLDVRFIRYNTFCT